MAQASCVLREELAYRSAAGDSIFAVQGLGSHAVVLMGTEAQRRELLPRRSPPVKRSARSR